VFRVSDGDAKALEDGFSYFTAREIQSLGTGEAICRLERADADFNLNVLQPESINETEAAERRTRIIDDSRRVYAKSRSEIEALFRQSAEPPPPSRTPIAEKIPMPEASVAAIREFLPPPEPPKPAPVVATSAPPPAPATQPKPEPVSKDLGIGGEQHQAIQQRIKTVAESLGFRTQIEKEVLGGQGRVDVFLERPGQQIACEVSVTNTIDFEIGNIRKCLAAEIPCIAFVSPDEKRLAKMAAAVTNSLGAEAVAKVSYFLPDQLIEHLQSLALQPAPPVPSEVRTVRGYQVRRSVVPSSPEELKSQEQEAMRLMAEEVKGRRKRK
jgi:hypothetical protein